MTGEARLAASERPAQCPVRMKNEWQQCQQAAGHGGPHTVWLAGFGTWQWPNKEPRHAR